MGSKKDEVTTAIAGETDATLEVGTSLLGMYLKVVVVDEDGNIAESDVTDAVDVNELALKSVEDASGGVGNIIIAYFNIPLDELTLSDVQIRRVSDDQLFPIESVILSSDGMSARVQLNDSQATLGATLEPNTDYNLIVTSDEGTASKVFSIPATADGVSVVGYDKDKRQIEVLAINTNNVGVSNWAATTAKYQFPEDEEVDYANLLGETVTFKYDQNNTISNLKKLASEEVVYGAFEVKTTSTTDAYLQDKLTEEKYYAQDAFSGKIPSTLFDDYENAVALDKAWTTADINGVGNGTTYAYGKIVLNTNGTIKSFWKLSTWSGNIFVKEVSGNSIISKTNQEQSLEKYTILADGHTIDVDDIEEGDIVFYNTTVKMAEVYDDVRVGELQAVYDNAGFKFEDKNRDGSAASYIDGTTQKTVDTDYLKALKAEGEDITVIFNRANEVIYVLGEKGEVVSNSYDMVLTAKGDGYAGTTTGVIAIKGFDGDSIVSKEIKVSDLAEVTVNGVTYKKTAGTFYTSTGAAGVETASDWGTAKKEEALGFSGTASDGQTAGTAGIVVLNTDLIVGTLVNVTENDNGAITKLNIKDGDALKPYVAAGARTIFGGADKSQDFKAGYSTLQLDKNAASAVLTLPSSAKVYVLAKSNGSVTVDKTTYGDFDKNIANANIAAITMYKSGTSVSDLIIDNTAGAAFSNDEDGATTIEGVVQEMHLLGGEVADITIVSKDGELTFDTFASDKTNLKTNFAQGTIVDVTVLKDGETVSKVVADGEPSGNYTNAVYGVTTTAPGSFYVQGNTVTTAKLNKRTLTSDALLVKVADNTVSTISLSDLKSLALKNNVVISTVVAGNDKVDTVVVTTTARPATGTHDGDGTIAAAPTTDFALAADALLNTIGTANAYKNTITVASDVSDASAAVSAIAIKDGYSAAKSAMEDLKILADDIIAADGTGSTIQNKVWTAGKAAYEIYGILSKKADATGADNTSVAWAGKNVIVANNTLVGTAARAATNASATAFLAEVPTSVTLESLDGTTYEITGIVKPTAGAAGVATLTAAADQTGWFWENTDTFDGNAAATYKLTLKAGATISAAYKTNAQVVTFSFEIT